MITLDNAGTRALSLITGQNGADVIVAFSDFTPATGAYARKAPTCTTVASATTTSICATPATASDIRDIDFLSIKNTFAGSHAMTLQITSGSGGPFVLANVTLLQNETLQYIHGTGLVALDVNGNRKEVTSSLFSSVTVTGTSTLGVVNASGLVTLNAGETIASGQTLTLTGATVAGAPTWSSNQAITLSTATQSNVTSLGTLTSLAITGDTGIGTATVASVPLIIKSKSSGGAWTSVRFLDGAGGTHFWDIGAVNAASNPDLFFSVDTVNKMTLDATGALSVSTTIRPGGYTVATLPAGTAGMKAYVTNAVAPAFLVLLAGGGAAYSGAQYSGTQWVGD